MFVSVLGSKILKLALISKFLLQLKCIDGSYELILINNSLYKL